MERLLSIIAGITTWSGVAILAVIAAIFLSSFFTYSAIEKYQKMEVLAGIKQVEISQKQLLEISEYVNAVIDSSWVGEYYVWVFQPDELIRKRSSELIYGHTNYMNWEGIRANHWSKRVMDLAETPSILLELNRAEFYLVDGHTDNYIGRYLNSSFVDYPESYIQGLYVNNLLVGYCTIMIKKPITELQRGQIFKVGRRINSIIFNY